MPFRKGVEFFGPSSTWTVQNSLNASMKATKISSEGDIFTKIWTSKSFPLLEYDYLKT